MKSSYLSAQRFYSEKAETFFEETLKIDLSPSYEVFLERLSSDALILDLGCGSGRDSKNFRKQGYSVESWEPNEKLACLAESYLDFAVKRASSYELTSFNKYHGIWASASLLHLDLEDFCKTLNSIKNALKTRGVFYTSFKWGSKDFCRDGRFFLVMNEERLFHCFEKIDGLSILEIRKRADHRSDRNGEYWLECIAVRSS